MDRSVSDTEIHLAGTVKTPPNFVFQRAKRSREEMEDTVTIQLNEFKDEIKKMFTVFSERQGSAIKKINSTLKEIQQSNITIQHSIEFLSAQNEELRAKINHLEKQSVEDKKCITLLENKIEEAQVNSRKGNLVIKNVPRNSSETKEDLLEMTTCLFQNLGCSIKKHDIRDIYRVRGKTAENQNTPIVVETGSSMLKTETLKMAKAFNIKHQNKLCCKHLGLKTQVDTPVFVSEHLTPRGSRLHFLARDLTKSGFYKFCWTAYGKVYVRRNESSQTINIRTEDQVHQLLLDK